MSGRLGGENIVAYDNLVSAFREASEASNNLVYIYPPLNSQLRAQGNRIALEGYLHLFTGTRKRDSDLSVLVHVRETISPTPLALLKSSIHVCYYSVHGNNAHFQHGIHFDYGPAQDLHPLFHAQLCLDDIDLSPQHRSELAFEWTVKRGSPSCFREARIPTSDMTFPSLLLCLAADHLQSSFLVFRDRVTHHQAKLPQPVCSTTTESVTAEKSNLRSHHWFAHDVRQ